MKGSGATAAVRMFGHNQAEAARALTGVACVMMTVLHWSSYVKHCAGVAALRCDKAATLPGRLT